MYIFLNEEVEEIAKSSEIDVNPSLRGYSLIPMFESLEGLNISDVVDGYCDTKRRIYLM